MVLSKSIHWCKFLTSVLSLQVYEIKIIINHMIVCYSSYIDPLQTFIVFINTHMHAHKTKHQPFQEPFFFTLIQCYKINFFLLFWSIVCLFKDKKFFPSVFCSLYYHTVKAWHNFFVSLKQYGIYHCISLWCIEFTLLKLSDKSLIRFFTTTIVFFVTRCSEYTFLFHLK